MCSSDLWFLVVPLFVWGLWQNLKDGFAHLRKMRDYGPKKFRMYLLALIMLGPIGTLVGTLIFTPYLNAKAASLALAGMIGLMPFAERIFFKQKLKLTKLTGTAMILYVFILAKGIFKDVQILGPMGWAIFLGFIFIIVGVKTLQKYTKEIGINWNPVRMTQDAVLVHFPVVTFINMLRLLWDEIGRAHV